MRSKVGDCSGITKRRLGTDYERSMSDFRLDEKSRNQMICNPGTYVRTASTTKDGLALLLLLIAAAVVLHFCSKRSRQTSPAHEGGPARGNRGVYAAQTSHRRQYAHVRYSNTPRIGQSQQYGRASSRGSRAVRTVVLKLFACGICGDLQQIASQHEGQVINDCVISALPNKIVSIELRYADCLREVCKIAHHRPRTIRTSSGTKK